MKTEVTEIAAKVYRLSTFLPKVGPTGFTFNQFLVDADQPLLFHYGQRALFPLVSEAVKSVIKLDKLAFTTCSHVEADESGALNEWLAAAPNAASLLRNPRRGEEQPQSIPGTLLFSEADIVHLPCEFAA